MTAGNASGLMQLVAPDAVMLEAGVVETRAQYESSHLPADIEFEKGVSTKRSPVRVVVEGDAAWATSTSEVVGTFQGRAIDFLGIRADGAQPRAWRLADQGRPLVVARPPQAGQVKGDSVSDAAKKELLEGLNEDLKGEFQAIIMYRLYASMVQGPYRQELRTFFANEIPEELTSCSASCGQDRGTWRHAGLDAGAGAGGQPRRRRCCRRR